MSFKFNTNLFRFCDEQVGAASSTIAMGDSDGSGQPAAQLRWAAAAAAAQWTAGWQQDHNGQRRR